MQRRRARALDRNQPQAHRMTLTFGDSQCPIREMSAAFSPAMFLHFLHVRSKVRRAGFTLLELLTVLVIIAILTALLLPVLGQARRQADSVRCVAQLGKIGTAIAAYAGDHDGLLPGPLTMKQSAIFDEETPGSLARLLESYLGGSGGSAASFFLCPAAARQTRDPKAPNYLVSMLPVPGFGQSAWGDAELHQEPLRQAALTNWAEDQTAGHPLALADVWAIKDADQAYFREINASTDSAEDLLPTPAHGDHRNALFHDFHVARVHVITILVVATPPPKSGSGKAK